MREARAFASELEKIGPQLQLAQQLQAVTKALGKRHNAYEDAEEGSERQFLLEEASKAIGKVVNNMVHCSDENEHQVGLQTKSVRMQT